ncbi:hypothetical protein GCM10010345_19810 [Streptomyces canarius]|uniref:Uncharacterized protein n=1 Tax=Streptomyces canarius TaxID=285453 RepID=A0ABQ3CHZ6_9ACTN|nr:hypothetical protein GCM10010345_19810 [Streptomyces canarius]
MRAAEEPGGIRGGEVLDSEQRAGDVDRVHTVEVLGPYVAEPGAPGGARVVDQAVHLPVRLLQFGGEVGPVLFAGHVEAAAVTRALPGQRRCLGGALATGRAGDHDHLAQQPPGVRGAHGRSRDRRRPAGSGIGSESGTTVLDTLAPRTRASFWEWSARIPG